MLVEIGQRNEYDKTCFEDLKTESAFKSSSLWNLELINQERSNQLAKKLELLKRNAAFNKLPAYFKPTPFNQLQDRELVTNGESSNFSKYNTIAREIKHAIEWHACSLKGELIAVCQQLIEKFPM